MIVFEFTAGVRYFAATAIVATFKCDEPLSVDVISLAT